MPSSGLTPRLPAPHDRRTASAARAGGSYIPRACRSMQRSPMRCGHRAVREPHWPLRDNGPAACPVRGDLGSRFICIQPESRSSGRSRRARERCASPGAKWLRLPQLRVELPGGRWGGASGRLALRARAHWSPSVPRSFGLCGASAEDARACTGQGCDAPGAVAGFLPLLRATGGPRPGLPSRRPGLGSERLSGAGGRSRLGRVRVRGWGGPRNRNEVVAARRGPAEATGLSRRPRTGASAFCARMEDPAFSRVILPSRVSLRVHAHAHTHVQGLHTRIGRHVHRYTHTHTQG